MRKTLLVILSFMLMTISLNFLYINVKAMTDTEWRKSFGGNYGQDDYTTPPPLVGNQAKIGFQNDWEKARDFGVKPINVGDQEIMIKTAPGAIIRISKNGTELYEISLESTAVNSGYIIKPTLANSSGTVTFKLTNSGTYENQEIKKNSEEKVKIGDKYFVSVSYDGINLGSAEWTVGESIPKDIEEKDEEEIQKFVEALENKEKEKADREQKYAEALFRNAIATEANKTWYQRLGDSIEDTWANVKGWWKG
ncbi:TPA: hypothetical protein TVR04_000768 [Streptococcus equi subsp. zooepidemicus]|nr:hypothetical protein [Streptococcus equi subsp. zooepidemicus]